MKLFINIKYLKIPEDTKNIKVGTLVGLMVLPGEDWKNVQVPQGEDKTAAAAAPTQQPDTPQTPKQQAASMAPAASHHQIDAHSLESLYFSNSL